MRNSAVISVKWTAVTTSGTCELLPRRCTKQTALWCLCRFAELLQVLGTAGSSEEVVQLVEERQFALNSTSAAEYLRALLETKRLDRLARGGAIQ